MSKFNPEHFAESRPEQSAPVHIGWRDLGTATKLKLVAVCIAEILCALGWAASFSTINPMGGNQFLNDLLPFPLPDAMDDMTIASAINLALGLLAVILPAVLWHYTLQNNVLGDIKGYFNSDPLRMTVASLLGTAYAFLIALEILALRTRVHNSLDTGPIPILGDRPEMLPLALASGALVLGSCLLGLASASLFRSIQNRAS